MDIDFSIRLEFKSGKIRFLRQVNPFAVQISVGADAIFRNGIVVLELSGIFNRFSPVFNKYPVTVHIFLSSNHKLESGKIRLCCQVNPFAAPISVGDALFRNGSPFVDEAGVRFSLGMQRQNGSVSIVHKCHVVGIRVGESGKIRTFFPSIRVIIPSGKSGFRCISPGVVDDAIFREGIPVFDGTGIIVSVPGQGILQCSVGCLIVTGTFAGGVSADAYSAEVCYIPGVVDPRSVRDTVSSVIHHLDGIFIGIFFRAFSGSGSGERKGPCILSGGIVDPVFAAVGKDPGSDHSLPSGGIVEAVSGVTGVTGGIATGILSHSHIGQCQRVVRRIGIIDPVSGVAEDVTACNGVIRTPSGGIIDPVSVIVGNFKSGQVQGCPGIIDPGSAVVSPIVGNTHGGTGTGKKLCSGVVDTAPEFTGSIVTHIGTVSQSQTSGIIHPGTVFGRVSIVSIAIGTIGSAHSDFCQSQSTLVIHTAAVFTCGIENKGSACNSSIPGIVKTGTIESISTDKGGIFQIQCQKIRHIVGNINACTILCGSVGVKFRVQDGNIFPAVDVHTGPVISRIETDFRYNAVVFSGRGDHIPELTVLDRRGSIDVQRTAVHSTVAVDGSHIFFRTQYDCGAIFIPVKSGAVNGSPIIRRRIVDDIGVPVEGDALSGLIQRTAVHSRVVGKGQRGIILHRKSHVSGGSVVDHTPFGRRILSFRSGNGQIAIHIDRGFAFSPCCSNSHQERTRLIVNVLFPVFLERESGKIRTFFQSSSIVIPAIFIMSCIFLMPGIDGSTVGNGIGGRCKRAGIEFSVKEEETSASSIRSEIAVGIVRPGTVAVDHHIPEGQDPALDVEGTAVFSGIIFKTAAVYVTGRGFDRSVIIENGTPVHRTVGGDHRVIQLERAAVVNGSAVGSDLSILVISLMENGGIFQSERTGIVEHTAVHRAVASGFILNHSVKGAPDCQCRIFCNINRSAVHGSILIEISRIGQCRFPAFRLIPGAAVHRRVGCESDRGRPLQTHASGVVNGTAITAIVGFVMGEGHRTQRNTSVCSVIKGTAIVGGFVGVKKGMGNRHGTHIIDGSAVCSRIGTEFRSISGCQESDLAAVIDSSTLSRSSIGNELGRSNFHFRALVVDGCTLSSVSIPEGHRFHLNDQIFFCFGNGKTANPVIAVHSQPNQRNIEFGNRRTGNGEDIGIRRPGVSIFSLHGDIVIGAVNGHIVSDFHCTERSKHGNGIAAHPGGIETDHAAFIVCHINGFAQTDIIKLSIPQCIPQIKQSFRGHSGLAHLFKSTGVIRIPLRVFFIPGPNDPLFLKSRAVLFGRIKFRLGKVCQHFSIGPGRNLCGSGPGFSTSHQCPPSHIFELQFIIRRGDFDHVPQRDGAGSVTEAGNFRTDKSALVVVIDQIHGPGHCVPGNKVDPLSAGCAFIRIRDLTVGGVLSRELPAVQHCKFCIRQILIQFVEVCPSLCILFQCRSGAAKDLFHRQVANSTSQAFKGSIVDRCHKVTSGQSPGGFFCRSLQNGVKEIGSPIVVVKNIATGSRRVLRDSGVHDIERSVFTSHIDHIPAGSILCNGTVDQIQPSGTAHIDHILSYRLIAVIGDGRILHGQRSATHMQSGAVGSSGSAITSDRHSTQCGSSAGLGDHAVIRIGVICERCMVNIQSTAVFHSIACTIDSGTVHGSIGKCQSAAVVNGSGISAEGK